MGRGSGHVSVVALRRGSGMEVVGGVGVVVAVLVWVVVVAVAVAMVVVASVNDATNGGGSVRRSGSGDGGPGSRM